MTIAAPADWREQEVFRHLIARAEGLEEVGHEPDEIADAMLGLGLAMSCGLHGPGPVAARLLKLARLFAADAEQRATAAAGPLVN